MRQLAKEIAGDIQEWTGSARFIDGLDSDQLIALISWLWLWDILYNQQYLYEETWARQRYPKNPFENLRTIPGKIITQARQGNPYPLHSLDSQDLQLVLTERMKGNLIRRPPTPEVSPESEVNDSPEPSRSSRSGEPSVVDPERCDEQAAVDSELRTQDSELRTQDSGLRTQDSGLRTQDFGLTASAEAQAIWSQVLNELSQSMPSATFHTWVRDTWGMAYTGAEFVIGLPNPAARDWILNRLRYKVQRTLASLLHQSVTVRFEVVEPPRGGRQA